MIPIGRVRTELGCQLVLAGDPQQLGPVVKSQYALHFGLGPESLILLDFFSFSFISDPCFSNILPG